jgi:hypothetical protein
MSIHAMITAALLDWSTILEKHAVSNYQRELLVNFSFVLNPQTAWSIWKSWLFQNANLI